MRVGLAGLCLLSALEWVTARAGPDHPSTIVPGPAPGAGVTWMAFAPDGRHLAVRYDLAEARGIQDAVVGVVDTATGAVVTSARLSAAGRRHTGRDRPFCAISPRGDWVAFRCWNDLRFLAIPPHKPALPGGGTLAVGRLPDPAGHRVWLDPTGSGAYLESATATGRGLWRVDVATSRAEQVVRNTGPATSDILAVDPMNRRLITGSGPDPAKERGPVLRISGFDAAKGKVDAVELSTASEPWAAAFQPGGPLLAVGFMDGTVAWYDAATGKAARHLRLGQFTISGVAFHPDGRHLACGTCDRRGAPNLFLLRLDSGKVVSRVVADDHGVTAVCFDAAGTRVAAAGSGGVVKIWDANKLLGAENE